MIEKTSTGLPVLLTLYFRGGGAARIAVPAEIALDQVSGFKGRWDEEREQEDMLNVVTFEEPGSSMNIFTFRTDDVIAVQVSEPVANSKET